eukprot:PhM_4_TR8421/c0_g2_i3/m.55452
MRPYPISTIFSNKKCIVGSRPVTAFMMNQYVVMCTATKKAALIDCGDVNVKDWVEYVKGLGGDISAVLQTHAHIDHITGLRETQRMLPSGTPVYMHNDDLFWFDLVNDRASSYGLAPVEIPLPPTNEIKADDNISIGELEFRAVHCPGHTPGQCVFYEAEAGIAFTGDMLFAGSVGRTDLPGSSVKAMSTSLSTLMHELSDDTVIFPGHNEPSTIGKEKRSNPYCVQVMRTGSL